MKHVTFLTTLATLSLAACGKSEDVPARVDAAPARPTPSTQQVSSVTASSALAPASYKPDLARGEQIYRQTCAFCHDQGVTGAPKIGDTGAWSPRLAQGMDSLYASALHGRNAMPAKGGNPSLADADVRAAVDYLAAHAR